MMIQNVIIVNILYVNNVMIDACHAKAILIYIELVENIMNH